MKVTKVLYASLLAVGLLMDGWIASAKDVVWTGAVNGNWDTSTQNWLADGQPATFAEQDNVLFADSAGTYNVEVVGSFKVGRVVFSNSNDYILSGGAQTQGTSGQAGLQEAPRFEKWGSGKLSITGFHSFTGDVLVAEGQLSTPTPAGDKVNAVQSALGNPRWKRTVTVWTNAVLNFLGKGPTGAGTSTIDVKMAIEVLGGTLNLEPGFATTLGNVWFENATLGYTNGASQTWRTMAFNGDWLRFSGTNAMVFPWPDVNDNTFGISVGRAKPLDVYVDDITGDNTSDVVWQLPVARIGHASVPNPCSFNKLGPGILDLACAYNTFTGEVRVLDGTLRCSKGRTHRGADSSNLGSTTKPHKIYVGTNGVLEFTASDIMGQAWAPSEVEITVDGGTLRQTKSRVNGFGRLILNNATLDYDGVVGNWGTFAFNGDVTFSGTNAYELAENSGSKVRCGYNGMIFFDVDDIPDKDIDLTFGMRIDDCDAWSTYEGRPSQFGKRGAGVMRLTNRFSSFNGDVEVAEGILQVTAGASTENMTNSCLGNPQNWERTVLVHSGAELQMLTSDLLGQLSSTVQLGMVISNATLRIGNSTCNGIGPIKFYDGQFLYKNGMTGTRLWGVIGFSGRVILDGTVPYNWQINGSNNRFNLGYADEFVAEPLIDGTTNYIGKTTFEVCDITHSPATDATIGVPIQSIPAWPNTKIFSNVTFRCGLIKEGAGTLCLTAENYYDGPTSVKDGVLRIDGKVMNSVITVMDEGWLGGTGSVGNVTVESGAGFEIFADQEEALEIDALTVMGEVVIRVRNPDALPREGLRVPFAQIGYMNGAFIPSNWRVEMDDVAATPNLNVMRQGDLLVARWSPPGTLFMIN